MTGQWVRAVRAELIKLATLPPVWLTIGVTVAAAVLLDVASALEAGRASSGSGAASHGAPALHATGPVALGFALLGTLAATSEVAGGQLRVTLLAVPARRRAGTAKIVAVSAFALPSASAVTGLALVIARVSDPSHIARAALGAVAYLVLIAVLALGVASVVRDPLVSLLVTLGYLGVLGPLLRGAGVGHDVLPDAAGARLWRLSPDVTAMSWLSGGAVLGTWAAAASVVGVTVWCHRDVG